MELRPIEERDLEAVRLLRNESRRWFFFDGEIDADMQRRWFERLATLPVVFYVIEIDGAVVGTASLTETPEGLEVGNLLLDPAVRGRGLMRQVVAELTAAPGTYTAQVMPDNASSIAVFEASGFSVRHLQFEKRVGP